MFSLLSLPVGKMNAQRFGVSAGFIEWWCGRVAEWPSGRVSMRLNKRRCVMSIRLMLDHLLRPADWCALNVGKIK